MDQANTPYKDALNKAAALCSTSEKCAADILKKMDQWHVDADTAKGVIDTLIKEKFIDHNRFATFFVKDKFRFNKWGKRKIAFELSRKAIERDIINQAIAEIDDNDYLEAITDILNSKKRQLRAKDPWQTKAALVRFGLSKGFESDVVTRAVNKLVSANDDDE